MVSCSIYSSVSLFTQYNVFEIYPVVGSFLLLNIIPLHGYTIC